MITRRNLIGWGATWSLVKPDWARSQEEPKFAFSARFRDVIREAEAAGLDVPAAAPSDNQLEQAVVTLGDIIQKSIDLPPDRGGKLASDAGELLSRVNEQMRDFPFATEGAEAPPSFASIRSEYKSMFQRATVNANKKKSIYAVADRILRKEFMDRYKEVEKLTGVPWHVVGALHYREASLNFMGHLHNGDYLKNKTHQVPPNRPPGEWPPVPWDAKKAWLISAQDALSRFKHVSNWTLERTLYSLEAYNGWGYRSHPGFVSPYIWNYTQFYKGGGYPCDRCWSASYMSKQAGLVSVILALRAKAPEDVKLRFEP